jgi:Protein of unknown function (DUF2752)
VKFCGDQFETAYGIKVRNRTGISFRPLAPRETDFEFLFLGVSLMLGVSCFSWIAFGLPWPKCWFRQITGIPCPGCAATRCALSLVHGDFWGALGHNPLAFVLYLGTLAFDLYCTLILLFRIPRPRLYRLPAKVKSRLCVIILLAVVLNWVYLVANR